MRSKSMHLRIDWRKLDDAFLSFERAILLVPDVFPRVPGTRLRRVQLIGFDDLPPISIFFAVLGDVGAFGRS
jgi:hypothetical protein